VLLPVPLFAGLLLWRAASPRLGRRDATGGFNHDCSANTAFAAHVRVAEATLDMQAAALKRDFLRRRGVMIPERALQAG
jgi:hypothetical protein